VGENKSKTDESIPTWLSGLGSETPEQRLAFQNWLGCRGDLDDKLKERVDQGLLRIIRGEYGKVH